MKRLNSHVLTACIAAVVAFGASWTAGRRIPDVLTAQRFSLIDDDGQLRGNWGIAESGDVKIALYDSDGNTRAEMLLSPDGESSISLRTESRSMVSMAAGPLASEMSVYNARGELGVHLEANTATSSVLVGAPGGVEDRSYTFYSIIVAGDLGYSSICQNYMDSDVLSSTDCWGFVNGKTAGVPGNPETYLMDDPKEAGK